MGMAFRPKALAGDLLSPCAPAWRHPGRWGRYLAGGGIRMTKPGASDDSNKATSTTPATTPRTTKAEFQRRQCGWSLGGCSGRGGVAPEPAVRRSLPDRGGV